MRRKQKARIGSSFDSWLREELRDEQFRKGFEERVLARKTALAVRRMREAAGLTQSELAERIGAKQPLIARLERGENTPSLETLARIATALGWPMTLLFGNPKTKKHIRIRSDKAA